MQSTATIVVQSMAVFGTWVSYAKMAELTKSLVWRQTRVVRRNFVLDALVCYRHCALLTGPAHTVDEGVCHCEG